jgi:hypothetical protein
MPMKIEREWLEESGPSLRQINENGKYPKPMASANLWRISPAGKAGNRVKIRIVRSPREFKEGRKGEARKIKIWFGCSMRSPWDMNQFRGGEAFGGSPLIRLAADMTSKKRKERTWLDHHDLFRTQQRGELP